MRLFVLTLLLTLLCALPTGLRASDDSCNELGHEFGFENSFAPLITDLEQSSLTPDPLIQAMLTLPMCDHAFEQGAQNGLMSMIDDGASFLHRMGQVVMGGLRRNWATAECMLTRNCDSIRGLLRSDLRRIREGAQRVSDTAEFALMVSQTPMPIIMSHAFNAFTEMAHQKWSNFSEKSYLEKVQMTCEFMGEAGIEAAVGLVTGGAGAVVRNGLRAGRLAGSSSQLLSRVFRESAQRWEPPESFSRRYRVQRRRQIILRGPWESTSVKRQLASNHDASAEDLRQIARTVSAHRERARFERQVMSAGLQRVQRSPGGRTTISMRNTPQNRAEVAPGGSKIAMTDGQRNSLRLRFGPNGEVILPRFDRIDFDMNDAPIRRGRYIYVMNERGEIFIAPNATNVRHSSFFRGGPVAAAGEINIENGRITYINDSSGHYQPPIETTIEFMATLRQQGATLPNEIQLYSEF